MSWLDRIAECNDADLGRYRSWRAVDTGSGTRGPGGFVRRDRADRLLATDSPFARDGGALMLPGADAADRTARLEPFARALAAAGECSWRDEVYPLVAAHGDPPWAAIDRGVVPWLGVRPFGVHLCGYVRTPRGLDVWVAVRARDKTFPGMWDNTVAGGQPLGLSLQQNLVKECAEEAAIPAALARRAAPAGTITYVREDQTGLKPDTLFCFDLELPADFVPRPCDGEVERFERLPARELAAIVRDEPRCKPNCSLVWIDFLLRHGALDAELTAAQRHELGARLRAPLPEPA